eukprot:TRINITY_DN23307_c0_g2_i1.p1 TRINITY_DN23307_c0_g2~~TRINITY_DN23307_c0_g2_i1.p1  ORF type:complete len:209 (-),score=20.84 TRINITY_DN23307_c0_g2_i1:131-721(-)
MSSTPLRVVALFSLVLGLCGSLLALSATIWFSVTYLPNAEYGYVWSTVLVLYLLPSWFGLTATQLSLEVCSDFQASLTIKVAFNWQSRFWLCGFCCRYKPFLARAFTNISMIFSSLLLIQVIGQYFTLTGYAGLSELKEVEVLIRLLVSSLSCTCLCGFITSTCYLHLRTEKGFEMYNFRTIPDRELIIHPPLSTW